MYFEAEYKKAFSICTLTKLCKYEFEKDWRPWPPIHSFIRNISTLL
ncbi:hypothetical protein HMPREF9442_00307 [Paraprevotella xylaniphila YIT 11841]|uniref:Uncharacterized protein n=1 Tax=Paraprevotella xylaniphila YIT 11841 TaxID=762982 RepID=F3QQ69_9BACT|nr:hypothetical protein HMPREF9442_00307 [Paraprevotella xylaniphila YIT 11841]